MLESRVKQALGSHAAEGPWSISLVKLGAKWSVTLNGPGERFKSLSFTSDDARLQDAIRDAVGGGRTAEASPGTGGAGTAPGPLSRRSGTAGAVPTPSTVRTAAATTPSAARSGEARESHVCPQCRKPVIVVYETQAGEAKVSAPLACPYCWHVSHVEVGSWAATGGDYRAEKA